MLYLYTNQIHNLNIPRLSAFFYLFVNLAVKLMEILAKCRYSYGIRGWEDHISFFCSKGSSDQCWQLSGEEWRCSFVLVGVLHIPVNYQCMFHITCNLYLHTLSKTHALTFIAFSTFIYFLDNGSIYSCWYLLYL